MSTEPEKPCNAWDDIAEQLSREQDRTKAVDLAQKLNEAMLAAEREKVRRRLGIS